MMDLQLLRRIDVYVQHALPHGRGSLSCVSATRKVLVSPFVPLPAVSTVWTVAAEVSEEKSAVLKSRVWIPICDEVWYRRSH